MAVSIYVSVRVCWTASGCCTTRSTAINAGGLANTVDGILIGYVAKPTQVTGSVVFVQLGSRSTSNAPTLPMETKIVNWLEAVSAERQLNLNMHVLH
jgi:hypothetical protein